MRDGEEAEFGGDIWVLILSQKFKVKTKKWKPSGLLKTNLVMVYFARIGTID